jgi:hypothetical protein
LIINYNKINFSTRGQQDSLEVGSLLGLCHLTTNMKGTWWFGINHSVNTPVGLRASWNSANGASCKQTRLKPWSAPDITIQCLSQKDYSESILLISVSVFVTEAIWQTYKAFFEIIVLGFSNWQIIRRESVLTLSIQVWLLSLFIWLACGGVFIE